MPYSFIYNNVTVTCECECQCPFNQLYRHLEQELNKITNDNARVLTIELPWLYNKRNLFKKITKDVLTQVKYTNIRFTKCHNCPYIYYISFKRNPQLELEEVAHLNNGNIVSIN